MKNKGLVIITGIGMKEAKMTFKGPNPGTLIDFKAKKYKMNAASGTASILSQAGYIVYMLGSKEEYLKIIAEEFLKRPFYYRQIDLLDKKQVQEFVYHVEEIKKQHGLDIHLVQYGGVSDTPVPLPDDNVCLSPWEIPSGAIGPIVESNATAWLNLLQALEKTFKSQEKTKMILISAISAIRTKKVHTLDALQKGAVHAMARSLALDLTKEKIYVTEIMPGITDTGFYDNPATFKAMQESSSEFGYHYDRNSFPVFSPERVGEAVLFALDSNFHVRELSFMPYGQYPHLGS